MELAPLIRRRVRDRLSMRAQRLFDSVDVFSTVLRRVDRMLVRGDMRATTDAQLISLVLTIAENAVVDRHRVLDRVSRLESVDGPWVAMLRLRLENAAADRSSQIIESLFQACSSESERLQLSLRLNGVSHSMAAPLLGVSAQASRQRWVALKAKLMRDCFASDGDDS
ncbi:MAG: hypothetical protein AAFR96_06490 [Planctomycetota bacterium]